MPEQLYKDLLSGLAHSIGLHVILVKVNKQSWSFSGAHSKKFKTWLRSEFNLVGYHV